MATIVLVHGIDQQRRSADSLENEWLPALAGGVRTAGFPALADRLWRVRSGPEGIETRMAFYGHLFLQPSQQGDDPGDLNPDEAAFADALGEEWLVRGAERSADKKVQREAARELVYLRGQMGAQEQGVRHRVARPVINSLARVPWFARFGLAFAERFVRKALAQVTRYLTDDTIRENALTAVTDLECQHYF